MAYIWLGIMLICLGMEALTPQLTTLWFAAGALVAMVIALIAPQLLWLQILLFLIVSIVALILTRPLARKFVNTKKVPTNVDRVLGAEALVTEEIDNLRACGRVSVYGLSWSARSVDDRPIPADEVVVVRAIEGVKLLVEPKQN